MSTPDVGAHLALWGAFDLDSLGEQLRLRVVRAELARRRPDLTVRAYAPLGSTRPITIAEAEPVEALDPPGEHLARELAATLSAVVVTADLAHLNPRVLAVAYGDDESVAATRAKFLLSGAPGRPLAWHAMALPAGMEAQDRSLVRDAADGATRISARDQESRTRLDEAGIGGEIAVVGDPALLAPRVFSPSLLEKRRGFLRAMRWWPEIGRVVVVQGAADGSTAAGALDDLGTAISRTGATIIVIEADGAAGDGIFADALAASLGDAAIRLPAVAGVEDRVAAIAAADLVVASSSTVTALATAYSRPWAPLAQALNGDLTPREVVGIEHDVAALDAEYDELATLVPPGTLAPLVTSELRALRAALDARGHRLASERVAMADSLWRLRCERAGLLAERDAQIAALESENALLRSRSGVRARAAVGRVARRLRIRRQQP